MVTGVFCLWFSLGFWTGGIHFQMRENIFGAFDDARRQACEARDLNAVGLVRSSGQDFT